MATSSHLDHLSDAAVAVVGSSAADCALLQRTLRSIGMEGAQAFDRGGAVLTVLESREFDLMYLVGSPVDMDILTFIRAVRSAKLPTATPLFWVLRPTATLTKDEREFLKTYQVTVLKAALDDQRLFAAPLGEVFKDRFSKTSVVWRLESAKKLLREGLQSWAAKVYEEVLEEQEENITARVGLMRASTGNPEIYWKQLQKLLETDPKNYFFRFELIDRFMQDGRHNDAEHALASVTAQLMDAGDVFWLVELGVISVSQRIFSFCVKIADLIREKAGPGHQWQADLLLSRTHLAAGTLDEAQHFLDLAVAQTSEPRAEIENTKAIIARKRGNQKEAIARFHAALRLSPEDHRLAFNIGLCYELSGDFGQALNFYRQALSMSAHYLRARAKVEELEKRVTKPG